MTKRKINDIYGLYVARNEKADITLLVGVSIWEGENEVRQLVTDWAIDNGVDDEEFTIESVQEISTPLTDIEFTCDHLIAKS